MQARVCGTSRTKDAHEARLIAGSRGKKERKKKDRERAGPARALARVVYACEELCRGGGG